MINFKSKFLSVLLALVMVVGVLAPSVARATKENGKTDSITLHKLLLTQAELTDWDSDAIEKGTENQKGYDGTQNRDQLQAIWNAVNNETKTLKEIPNVYFAWQYKVGAEWKYIKGNANRPTLNPTGQLQEATNIDDAMGGLTTATGIEFTVTDLPQDDTTEYRIVEIKEKSSYNDDTHELTGSKAVPVMITLPLKNDQGVIVDAHVYPKNTEDKPKIDKDFKEPGANYDNPRGDKDGKTYTIGDKVEYQVKTKILAKSEYKKLVWTDIMTNGLTYNKDLVLKANRITGEGTIPESITFTKDTDYKLIQDDRGFTLKFLEGDDTASPKVGLAKLKEEAAKGDIEFVLEYSATLNGNAVVADPESNDIKLDFGNTPGKDFEEKPVTPKDNEISVLKTWVGGEPDDKVNVTYTLRDSNVVPEKTYSVTLKKATPVRKVFKLGDGITFEVTGEFAGTFKGLETGKEYKISERVSGYDPSIEVNNGEVTITNTKDKENPTPLDPTEPTVKTYGKRFVKTNDKENGTEGFKKLAGAEFVVKNNIIGDDNKGKYLALKDAGQTEAETNAIATKKAVLDEKLKVYNNLTKEEQEKPTEDPAKSALKEINAAQKEYNEAFIKARFQYKWVAEAEAFDTVGGKKVPKGNIVVLVSDAEGRFEITGLKIGAYELEEIKAPEGYALSQNTFPFNVTDTSYDGAAGELDYVLEGGATVHGQQVKNKEITIPQTGGMGTILFTLVGAGLMGSAVFAMKRREREEEEDEE